VTDQLQVKPRSPEYSVGSSLYNRGRNPLDGGFLNLRG
jgi:hypothetical protein